MPAFHISSTLRVFLSTVRSAAVLTAKQAHLARLRDVSLPSIYGLIGRHVMSLQDLPQDLCEARDSVRSIEERLSCSPKAGVESGTQGQSTSERNWISKTFQRLTNAIADAPVSVELQRAYEALGQNAAERHGTETVPDALAFQLAGALGQEAELKESVTRMHHAGITAVAQAACVGVLLFAMAWVLPLLAAPLGLMFMVSVIRDSLAYSPLAAVLVLGMNCLLVSVMLVVCSPRSLSTTMNRSLVGSLAACTALTLWWMFSTRREVTFFVGFYAWLACLVVFASALWLRNRTTAAAGPSWNPLESFFSVPGLVAAALACFTLACVLPVKGFSQVHGWGEFRSFASGGGYWMTVASKTTSLVAIASLVTLLSHQRLSTFIVGVLFAGCTMGVLVNLPYVLFEPQLRMGFYLWFASFCLLAIHTGRELLRRRTDAAGSCLIGEGMPRFAIAGVLAGLLLGLPMISGVSQAMIRSSPASSSVAQPSRPSTRKPVNQEPFDWGAAADRESARRQEVSPDAGTQAFLGLLAGIAAQQQAQQEAQQAQMQQQHERAAFRNQMRNLQTQYSRMPGPPQMGGPYGTGQFGGGGNTPQPLQQYEGTCTKCGYRTGRQVNQSHRTCSQLGVGADGTRPCGGVIAWAAAGAIPGAVGMVPQSQSGAFMPNGMQQVEGTCTRCGYRTGRQVNQTQRTCSQLGVGVDGTRPCGGVIAWAPAGSMPGAVPGAAGSTPQRQGGGYTPQRMQQFEGRCSRCGYRTGRQVNQSHRTCSQLGVGADGTRPCGGVIIWAPAQGY
jgi:hypothetical protein